MKVRGLTIGKLCSQRVSCDGCIYKGDKISACQALHERLMDATAPDECYQAMMEKYETDALTHSFDLEVKIKYYANITPIEKIPIGDWIDLRAAENIALKAGDSCYISLGVSMKLPEGYEAIVVPRSSLFRKKGLIQANSIAIIDNSYCGDGDIWGFSVYATRECTVSFNERICQFRLLKNQPTLKFTKVDKLDGENRGGFGSTGGYINES